MVECLKVAGLLLVVVWHQEEVTLPAAAMFRAEVLRQAGDSHREEELRAAAERLQPAEGQRHPVVEQLQRAVEQLQPAVE
jgi:hypothetical protein